MLNNEIIEQLKQEIVDGTIRGVSLPRPRRIFIQIMHNSLREVITILKKTGFSHLSGITGLQNSNNSIELLYHLDRAGTLITVRAVLPESEDSITTITDLIPGSSLYEREIHDLYGIKFEGHPDLR